MATLFDSKHVHKSAEVSECGRYRWWLRRSWSFWDAELGHIKGKGVCSFVMLNPSTADAMQDDPTIRRCIGFARSWGFDTLTVRNLFAWRATNPSELLRADTPTGGARGDLELLTACTANIVIAAWGADVPFGRDAEALQLFSKNFSHVPIYCLGKTKLGKPRHPLYVKGDTQPQLFIE